jgi:hypothetical protein
MEAACFLENACRSGKPLGAYKEQDIPLRWIPEKMKRYLYVRCERNRKRCYQIAMNFSCTGTCATVWKQAMSSAATASGSAV